MFPKTHKPENSRSLVISSVKCHSTNISHYVKELSHTGKVRPETRDPGPRWDPGPETQEVVPGTRDPNMIKWDPRPGTP